MKLQIGYDDFGKVRSQELNFVDKTLFIKEVFDNKNVEVSVITRPRRFGKTFNLSTLHHFLASEVNGQKTTGLFDGLKIAAVDNGSYMQYQGQYPVVFVSFKEAKGKIFGETLRCLQLVIQELYGTHRCLLSSDKLEQDEKALFRNCLLGDLDNATLEISVKKLTEFLYKYHNKKVYLLMDEYDTPIQSGYVNGYYQEIINLMRGMFGAALKTNPYLDRAVITGILRIAKESLFSGLNNVKVYSLLQSQYSQHFGFTEEEIHELLIQAKLENQETEVRRWYNGYVFGGTVVYNPWSIVNYINDQIFKAYWVNTSDNKLIKDLLVKSSIDFKRQFELLLQDRSIEKIIDENMVFGDLRNNTSAVWSLLLMSGYLKAVSTTVDMGNIICGCAIPNLEVKILYNNIIKEWLGNGHGIEWYQSFLRYLLKGDIEKFKESFGQVLAQTISIYDVAHNPEAFYHGFMLGLVAGIDQNKYEVKSNRESGLGRYDIAILPKEITESAIIMEFKSMVALKIPKRNVRILDSLLTQEAQKALKQINQQQYAVEAIQRGFRSIIKIGIAFWGKEFRVVSEGGSRKLGKLLD